MEKEDFPLSRNFVDWDPKYTLDRASLSQIIETIQKTKIKPKNKYEEILGEELQKIIPKLINQFDGMLKCESKKEHEVKRANLVGKMPKYVSINTEKHGRIKLNNAGIGVMIQALYQRVDFILDRDMPKFYKDDEEFENYFKNMQKLIGEFRQAVDEFEEDFMSSIDKAHKGVYQYNKSLK